MIPVNAALNINSQAYGCQPMYTMATAAPQASPGGTLMGSTPGGSLMDVSVRNQPVMHAYRHAEREPRSKSLVANCDGSTPGGPLMAPNTLVQSSVQPVQPLPISYKCNFLEQLQGTYEIDTPDSRERWAGPDKVHVLMPTWKNQAMGPGQMASSGCTIVRRVTSDGEALADQLILVEPNRFLLIKPVKKQATINQEVIAYMLKGGDMQNGLTWTKVDGTKEFWARVGKVTFNFVSPQTLNRSSHSLPQIGLPQLNKTFSNTSMSSVTSTPSVNAQSSSPEVMPQHAQFPARQQQAYSAPQPGLPRLTLSNNYSHHSEASHSSTDSFASSGGGQESYTHNPYDPAEQMLFESIKRFCHNRPGLIKRVVHWGLHRDQAPAPVRMSPELVRKLSQGRIWVCVEKNSTGQGGGGGHNDEDGLECLDDLKGAYQLDGSGCYIQPRPEANQPGTQHRVRKGADGYWMIEELGPESDHWVPRTVQQPGGRWWDSKAQKKVRIKLVMLEHILDRLGGDYQDGNIEKQMEFLFLSCNQKKLHTKLKQRNLKHNIANLKVKLEKQHCLSFAVRIANIADSIAKEFGVHTN